MKNKKIKLIPLILILAACTHKKDIIENYLASTNSLVELYDENYNIVKEIPRGTKIIEEEQKEDYIKIKFEENEYLVKNDTHLCVIFSFHKVFLLL